MIDLPVKWNEENVTWGKYQSANSGSVEREVGEILYSFARILKPHHILETGSHVGISAAYMGMACRDNGVGRVDTIEFDKSHWDAAKLIWNKMSLDEYIFQYKCSVDEFINDGIVYDLMFLDTEPARRWAELDRFYAQLAPGGYVFIHDLPRQFCIDNVNPDHPDIKNWPFGIIPDRVEHLMKDRLLVPFHFPNPRSMTGFYKARPDDYDIDKVGI